MTSPTIISPFNDPSRPICYERHGPDGVRIYPHAKTEAEIVSDERYVSVTAGKEVILSYPPRYLSPEAWVDLTQAVQRAFFLAYRDDLTDSARKE